MRLNNDTWKNWQEFCQQKSINPNELANFALMEFTVRHNDTEPKTLARIAKWRNYLSEAII